MVTFLLLTDSNGFQYNLSLIKMLNFRIKKSSHYIILLAGFSIESGFIPLWRT